MNDNILNRVMAAENTETPTQRDRLLRGGCEFSPDSVERRRLPAGDKSLALGTGVLEFGFSSGRRVVRESARREDFTSEELREVCQSIAFREPALALGSKLILLELGPHLAHAYWEVSQSAVAELCRRRSGVIDGAVLSLRFFELSRDRMQVLNEFSIDVKGLKSNWFTEMWEGGKLYAAELGYRFPDGGFERLVRSNVIELPRSKPVSDQTGEFLHINANRTLPRLPALPEIFRKEKRASASPSRPDSPYIDAVAESRVREVYQSLAHHGPRVLGGLAPLEPSSLKERIAQYRGRKQRATNAVSSAAFPEAARENDNDIVAQAARESRRHFAVGGTAKPAGPREEVPAHVGTAEKQLEKNMILTAEKVRNPLLEAMITEPSEPAPILPVGVTEPAPEPEPECVTVAAVSQESAVADMPVNEDPFLGGIDVEVKPEPERYWGERRFVNRKKKVADPGAWQKRDTESFCDGLDFLSEPEDTADEDTAACAENPAENVEQACSESTVSIQPEVSFVPVNVPEIVDIPADSELEERTFDLQDEFRFEDLEGDVMSEPVTDEAETSDETVKEDYVEESLCGCGYADEEEADGLEQECLAEEDSFPCDESCCEKCEINESLASDQVAVQTVPAGAASACDLDSFDLTATLRLSGNVPAGATLMIDGREIAPCADGSYEIECSLKDGELNIPFAVKAPAGQGSSRSGQISLGVSQSSRHSVWDKLKVVKNG